MAGQKIPKLLVPTPNGREAAVVEAIEVFGALSLAEAVGILSGQLLAEPMVQLLVQRDRIDEATIRRADRSRSL